MVRILLLILMVCVATKAWADPLAQTPDERRALVHLDRREFIDARRLIEKSIKEKETFLALYILGMVHAGGEGNLARGLFLLRKSKAKLLEQYGSPPESTASRKWHKTILLREQGLLGLMDRREEQLKSLDEYDAIYKPKQTARRIWPLLKLERFDEARKIGVSLIHHERPEIRERAYNGLMAVEEEAGNRKASYTWGEKGLAESRRESCVIATNVALGARRTFQFARTIEHDQTALKARDDSCPTSPHSQLAAMYLVFGEFQKSLSSLKALRSTPRTPDMRIQNEMVIKARFVELLHALGAFDEAFTRIEQIMDAPDRMGMESTSPEIRGLSNNILAWSVANSRLEQIKEKQSARPFWVRMRMELDARKVANTRWRAQREARRLAALPHVLLKTTRPYLTDVMPWYGGDVIPILGEGVIAKSIAEARRLEIDYPKEAGLFLDVLVGEGHWRQGRWTQAAQIAKRLLQHLPKEPKLVRMRIRAWYAASLIKLGRMTEAQREIHQVMNFYPTVLRHLGIPIPVRVEATGSRSTDIRSRLDLSPRLNIQATADLKIQIEDSEGMIAICLHGKKLYGCGTLRNQELKDAKDPIATVIDNFHNTVFSPRIELTQSDINSLDGRSVRQDARSAIDSLLGKKKKRRKKK